MLKTKLLTLAILAAASITPRAYAESPLGHKLRDTGYTLPPECPELSSALLEPSEMTAPESYTVRFKTSKGPIVVKVQRDWAPKGADRFYTLVKIGYFTDIAFFRVVAGFMAQFGIHGEPEVNSAWRTARIPDDKVIKSNERGMVSFATAGKDSRTTQVFINFKHNKMLDGMGFAPFGQVIEGMEVVDALYQGYGEGAPRGKGPHQGLMHQKGNRYLYRDFPNLDYVYSAEIVP